MNQYILPILATTCFTAIVFALWMVSNKRNEKTTLRWGLALILIGLFSSLYMSFAPKTAQLDQYDFLKNLFIIIASIGANFVAASALLEPPKDTAKESPAVNQTSSLNHGAPAIKLGDQSEKQRKPQIELEPHIQEKKYSYYLHVIGIIMTIAAFMSIYKKNIQDE